MIIFKNFKIMLIITLVFFSLLFCSCSKENFERDSHKSKSHGSKSDGGSVDEYYLMLDKINELNNIQGIDDIVILVNDYEITKRDLEFQIIRNNQTDSAKMKAIIGDQIRECVIRSKADELGVVPSQQDVDMYLNSVKQAYESGAVNSEYIRDYISSLEVTDEEFWQMQADAAYYIFQKDALRLHIENKYGNFDEYIDDLVEDADIVFYDESLKEIYENY